LEIFQYELVVRLTYIEWLVEFFMGDLAELVFNESEIFRRAGDPTKDSLLTKEDITPVCSPTVVAAVSFGHEDCFIDEVKRCVNNNAPKDADSYCLGESFVIGQQIIYPLQYYQMKR
jgi:hypothetical protein